MVGTGVDRRPGAAVPVEKPIPTSPFAHLARSGSAKELLLISSSMAETTFIAMTLVYGFDSYFFEGYYGRAVWKIAQQIVGAFRF
jgi:hypothetical protein